MGKLDAWHAALRLTMHLATLNSERSDALCPRQKFCLLLVHLLYLGAVTLLHKPVLAALAEVRRSATWTLDVPPDEVRSIEEDCILAASQGARVVLLLKGDTSYTTQCDIVM